MIVINSRFLTQKITGVQRYAIEICKKLPELIKNEKIVFVAPKQPLLNKTHLPNIEILQVGNFSGNLWEQIDLVLFLKKHKSPVLINFSGIGPTFYKNKILYIHDLSFKYFPEHFSYFFQKSYNFLIPISAKNSKKVITVSDYVKKDLETVLEIKNIQIIYPAISSKFKQLNLKREKIILCVSSIDPRKNIIRVIKAYQNLKTDYKLIFIGSKSNSFSTLKLKKEKLNTNITFTGYLDDNKLIEYYNRASIFVYASTFEGFGIPPLEAQACGCPCIISKTTSLPEVGLNSVEYCDPFSIDDIKNKIENLVNDEDLRSNLISKGFINVERFGWKTSAEKLTKIIANYV